MSGWAEGLGKGPLRKNTAHPDATPRNGRTGSEAHPQRGQAARGWKGHPGREKARKINPAWSQPPEVSPANDCHSLKSGREGNLSVLQSQLSEAKGRACD